MFERLPGRFTALLVLLVGCGPPTEIDYSGPVADWISGAPS